MAISFGAVGAKVITGTTTLAIAYPAGITPGQLIIACRAGGNQLVTFTAEAGWVNFTNLLGGLVGTNSADSHQSRVGTETKLADGSESGSVTFDQAGTADGMCGIMARYANATSTWGVTAATGDDNTHAANRAATASAALDFLPGDMLVAVVAVDTDVSLTITSPALTVAGVTFGATTQRAPVSAGYTTGFDGNIYLFDALVASGSATAAPSLAFTTATSQCGPVAFMRLRELPEVQPVVPNMAVMAA